MNADGLRHGACVLGRLLLHRAADLTDERDGFGAWVPVKAFERIARRRADDRIAADADERGDAEPRLHEVEAQQRAERPRPRDDAHLARLEHALVEGRHEADEGLAGRDQSGRVRANHLGAALTRRRQDVHRVVHRHVLREADDLANAGVDGIERSGLHAKRRDEHHRAVDHRFLCSVLCTCPNRQVKVRFARALRIRAANDPRAVGPHLVGPECALLARDAHHEHGFLAAHDHREAPFAASTAAFTASSMRS